MNTSKAYHGTRAYQRNTERMFIGMVLASFVVSATFYFCSI